MVALPPYTPVTIPVYGFTIALVVSLLLQVPPLVESDKLMKSPAQTVSRPVIADSPAQGVAYALLPQTRETSANKTSAVHFT